MRLDEQFPLGSRWVRHPRWRSWADGPVWWVRGYYPEPGMPLLMWTCGPLNGLVDEDEGFTMQCTATGWYPYGEVGS